MTKLCRGSSEDVRPDDMGVACTETGKSWQEMMMQDEAGHGQEQLRCSRVADTRVSDAEILQLPEGKTKFKL